MGAISSKQRAVKIPTLDWVSTRHKCKKNCEDVPQYIEPKSFVLISDVWMYIRCMCHILHYSTTHYRHQWKVDFQTLKIETKYDKVHFFACYITSMYHSATLLTTVAVMLQVVQQHANRLAYKVLWILKKTKRLYIPRNMTCRCMFIKHILHCSCIFRFRLEPIWELVMTWVQLRGFDGRLTVRFVSVLYYCNECVM